MTKIQRGSKIPAEVQQLAKSKRAEVTKNQDGSVTRRRTTARTSKELTTSSGKLLETTLEYRKSATTARGTQSESSFTAKTDMLGRASSQARRESTSARGDTTLTGRTTDVFGVDKQTRERNTTRVRGATTQTATRTSSKDSRGNQATSSDVTRVTEQGKSVVTTNEKRAHGSDLATHSSTTFEGGKFTLSDGADWTKNTSVDKSSLRETAYDPSKVLARADKFTPLLGKVFKALGLEGEWKKSLSDDLMKAHTLFQSDHGSVTTQVGVSGSQRFSIDGEGVQASFDRTAKAGIYAESAGQVAGRYGEASYQARAQAEAIATVDGHGKIDANGLDAVLHARVSASVQAEITARAQTQSVTFAGTELNASIEGHAKAVAEVAAEATGHVQITRNPPTAIVEGTAGASAVAKIEGEVRVSAGPFSVVGSAYASAGAEARASGILGFQDGKLKIGGSAGAALGLGAGAGVTVEIDVAQIGAMAKHAADVNGDGKLGLDDAAAAVNKSAHQVAHWFGF